MSNKVNPIPEGYHTITPFILVKDAKGCMEFIKDAFEGVIIDTHFNNDGTLVHGAMRVGDSRLMLAEARDQYPPMPAMYYLYVTDTDAAYHRAVANGGTSLREPTNEFYGDRSAGVADNWGNQWWIATHMEDVSPEEMAWRQAELSKQ